MIGAGSILSLLAGWLGDRVDQRRLLLFTFATIAVVSWIIFHGPTTPGPHYVLSFLMGVFASGFLYTNCNTAMQRAVRPEHVGRGTGTFMSSYYITAAFSGLLFAQLIGGLGWANAALVQFTVLPVVAIIALLLVNTSLFNNARQAQPVGTTDAESHV